MEKQRECPECSCDQLRPQFDIDAFDIIAKGGTLWKCDCCGYVEQEMPCVVVETKMLEPDIVEIHADVTFDHGGSFSIECSDDLQGGLDKRVFMSSNEFVVSKESYGASNVYPDVLTEWLKREAETMAERMTRFDFGFAIRNSDRIILPPND